ncbi:carbohydrate kinase [Pelomonas sp. KK5]|uniref:carbohydrate kinase family protein n=1 Tax=Pelomonas sp. KK5 TaxID=1855730 RepID=UPI00097C3758|nr:carbohydrate kinase [Pelomonas sp. KK5]
MFLVCGEALMDVFSMGDTPTGVALDARVGGSPLNVAVGLARLAQPVAFYGGLSSDFLGERLARALAQEGVELGHAPRLDAPTTVSLVGLNARGVPSYAFLGHGAADRQVRIDTLPPAGLFRAVHVGSYATVVEPVAGTQRALIEREQGRALIAYDPNIRLNVEPRLQAWLDQLEWMLPRTQLLKISDEDLGLLLPGTTPAVFAERALAAGVQLVVVTRGGEGALGWTRAHHAETAARPVTVIDTVGAGDTFQAALLTWLAERDALSGAALSALDGAQLLALLEFAGAAAAITCSRRGADLPHRRDLP